MPITLLITLGGMQLNCKKERKNYLSDVPVLALFLVSNICLIFFKGELSITHMSQDSTTSWTVETVESIKWRTLCDDLAVN